jgi:hypothetical protein
MVFVATLPLRARRFGSDRRVLSDEVCWVGMTDTALGPGTPSVTDTVKKSSERFSSGPSSLRVPLRSYATGWRAC